MEPIASAWGVVLVKSGDTLTAEVVARIQALAAAGVLASSTVRVVRDKRETRSAADLT
jgi:hypothetical protein